MSSAYCRCKVYPLAWAIRSRSHTYTGRIDASCNRKAGAPLGVRISLLELWGVRWVAPYKHFTKMASTFQAVQLKSPGARGWLILSSPPMRCTFRIPGALLPYICGLAQDNLRETSPEFTRFNGGISAEVYRRQFRSWADPQSDAADHQWLCRPARYSSRTAPQQCCSAE